MDYSAQVAALSLPRFADLQPTTAELRSLIISGVHTNLSALAQKRDLLYDAHVTHFAFFQKPITSVGVEESTSYYPVDVLRLVESGSNSPAITYKTRLLVSENFVTCFAPGGEFSNLSTEKTRLGVGDERRFNADMRVELSYSRRLSGGAAFGVMQDVVFRNYEQGKFDRLYPVHAPVPAGDEVQLTIEQMTDAMMQRIPSNSSDWCYELEVLARINVLVDRQLSVLNGRYASAVKQLKLLE
jgi:hypothetical protein